jgi:hypothetical protein
VDSLFVGLARPSIDITDADSLGNIDCDSMDVWLMDANSGCLWGNGKQANNDAGEFEEGDRLGVLTNLEAGSVLFFKNGVKHGPGFTSGVTAPVVLAMQFAYKGEGAKILAGAAWPSGYCHTEGKGLASMAATAGE